MAQYNTQSIPDLTNKYKKYLGKFGEALNYKDTNKINLYSQKLKMYNKLLQSGGNLDEQLKITMAGVNTSLQGLKTGADTTKIAENITKLKTRFDELTNSYANNANEFLNFANNTKKALDTHDVKPLGDIKELNDLLATSDISVDTFVQAQMFKNIIRGMDVTNLNSEISRSKLEALATFPSDDLKVLITFLADGNSALGIEKNEALASALPNAIAGVSKITTGTTMVGGALTLAEVAIIKDISDKGITEQTLKELANMDKTKAFELRQSLRLGNETLGIKKNEDLANKLQEASNFLFNVDAISYGRSIDTTATRDIAEKIKYEPYKSYWNNYYKSLTENQRGTFDRVLGQATQKPPPPPMTQEEKAERQREYEELTKSSKEINKTYTYNPPPQKPFSFM